MTDTSSSPRWWDFNEFSSAEPANTQQDTRAAQPATAVPAPVTEDLASDMAAPVNFGADVEYGSQAGFSDQAKTQADFIANLPDDMAEAEIEAAGYTTTPPADMDAVPPPPASDGQADWDLPSMPGFAADLPVPPASPQAAPSPLDLPDETAIASDGLNGDSHWGVGETLGTGEPLGAGESLGDDVVAGFDVPSEEVTGVQEGWQTQEATPIEATGWGMPSPVETDPDLDAGLSADVDSAEDITPWAGDVIATDDVAVTDFEPVTPMAADLTDSADSGSDLPDWMATDTQADVADTTGDTPSWTTQDTTVGWGESLTPGHDATPLDIESTFANEPESPAWGVGAASEDDAPSWDVPGDTEVTFPAPGLADDGSSKGEDLSDDAAWSDDESTSGTPSWLATDTPEVDSSFVGSATGGLTHDETIDVAQYDAPDSTSGWGAPVNEGVNEDLSESLGEWGSSASTPLGDTSQVASWATSDVEPADASTPTWGEAAEDPNSIWGTTAGEAKTEAAVSSWETSDTSDPSPTWGALEDDSAKWQEEAPSAAPAWGVASEGGDGSWDVPEAPVVPAPPASPAPPAPPALSFSDHSDEVLGDTFSADSPIMGDPSGFQAPAPPPPPSSAPAMMPMAPEDLPEWMRPDPVEDEPVVVTPQAPEEVMVEELAAPFNPVVAGVEEGAPGLPVKDPGLITAPIPEEELPPPPSAPGVPGQPARPMWGQPGPSGIGPAPITSPTLSHPVPDGSGAPFAPPVNKAAGKQSSIKRILIAVLATLVVFAGAFAAWTYVIQPQFFGQNTSEIALEQGNSTATFSADQDNQVQWSIQTQPDEAFALTVETSSNTRIGFIAQNADGESIGAANALEGGRNGYRLVAYNPKGGLVTVTARAEESINANVSMHIVPFAGAHETVDGLNWSVQVPAGQSATINVITRGAAPKVEIADKDGNVISESESHQSPDDETAYNAQFSLPKQDAQQDVVITLRTDQAYQATSTLIVDLSK